jgi:hypothetical protein
MRRQAAHHRRGGVLVYVAVAMPVVFLIASLAVDLGRMQLARNELQAAVDAAVRHAASGISDGTAVTKAITAAGQNRFDGGQTLTITASDIQLGNWNTTTRTFTAGGSPQNAVRISVSRSIPLFLAGAAGFGSATVNVEAVCRQLPTAGYGFVGLNWIDLNSGIASDSYDSSTAPYSASTAGNLGGLASNGSIALNNVTVSTNLYMRPGQSLSSSSSTYGSRVNVSSNISFPTPSASPYSSSNNNNNLISPSSVVSGGSFNAGNGNVTIPAGNYYFTNFTTNGTTVNVTGAATIYLNGSMDINNTTWNVADTNPHNFQVRVVATSGSPLVRLNSSSSVAMDIYAPTADVEFNSVQPHFYGRIIGKTLKVNSNTKMHYDISLPSMGGSLPPSGTTPTGVSLVR